MSIYHGSLFSLIALGTAALAGPVVEPSGFSGLSEQGSPTFTSSAGYSEGATAQSNPILDKLRARLGTQWAVRVLGGLHTQILFPQRTHFDPIKRERRLQSSPVLPKAETVVALFGGIGGDESVHDTLDDHIDFVNWTMAKGNTGDEKISPIVAENPIYGHILSGATHRPEYYLEQFGTLEGQLKWMASYLQELVKETRNQQDFYRDPVNAKELAGALPSSKKIVVVVRSTSGVVMMELLHRYLKGDTHIGDFELPPGLMQNIDSIVWQGVANAGSPQALDNWLKAKQSLVANDGAHHNPRTAEAAIALAKQNGYSKGEPVVTVAAQYFPKLYAVIASHDQFQSRNEQLFAVSEYARLHPGLNVVAVGLDTPHNATQVTRGMTINGRFKVNTESSPDRLWRVIGAAIRGEAFKQPDLALYGNFQFGVPADVIGGYWGNPHEPLRSAWNSLPTRKTVLPPSVEIPPQIQAEIEANGLDKGRLEVGCLNSLFGKL